jgi:hypothetical protein
MKSLLLLLLTPLVLLADSGADVAVVFNSRSVDSRDVAAYYAERRGVPASQVWGFDMSTAEPSHGPITSKNPKPHSQKARGHQTVGVGTGQMTAADSSLRRSNIFSFATVCRRNFSPTQTSSSRAQKAPVLNSVAPKLPSTAS